MDEATKAPVNWPATIGWAVYLAVSWTWCIGMFLPILLVRDFGLPGFLAFAVPNVIGAAAMGWMVASPRASVRFVERHRGACALFGCVTALFHLAFLARVVYPLDALHGGLPGVIGLLLGAVALSFFDRPRTIAVATYLVSAVVIGILLFDPGLPLLITDPGANSRFEAMRLPPLDVLFLAPACVFGFLLCPYLDLTFHRARQALPGGASRAGFALGFGVFFLAMIAFTPMYGSLFVPSWLGPGVRPEPMVVALVLTHLCAQSAATIGFHTHELARCGFPKLRWALVGVLGLVLGWIMLPRVGASLPPTLADPEERLIWYRLFMSCYGLLFPAYVWLVAIPTADGHSGVRGPQSRRKVVVMLIACALAAPCFWLGFVERETMWLGPGMAIVLLSRLLVRSGRASISAA
jgi:hypothetical protein